MKKRYSFFCFLCLFVGRVSAQEGMIMTVNGPVSPSEMGLSLVHEHVLVDFREADGTGAQDWERSEVIQVVRPYLEQVKQVGVKTLIECTPAFLGRDPLLLRELSY